MSELPDQYRDAVTFAFGDLLVLADELLVFVLAGKKTATCAALRDYAEDNPDKPGGRQA